MVKLKEKGLGKKVFVGSIWTVISRLIIRALGFISVIILARLLDPEDFGLVAKASMIQSVLLMFTEMGLETALIKDQKANKEDYNTVWTLHIIRGVFLALILVLIAKPISIFLYDERLQNILYCYAFVIFLSGFYNIGVVDFRKKFEFSLDFKYGLFRKIMAFATTITIAYIWQTYWALLAGVVAGQLTAIITSYIMSNYRPNLNLTKWKSLFHFSKWMTLHELLTSLGSKMDTFILSRFSSTTTLGLYTVANELSVTPISELSMPVARAMLPGLSKLENDIEQARIMNHNVIELLLLYSIPAAIGIHILSTHLTLIVLGEKWLAAAPFVSIISLSSFTVAFTAPAVAIFVAIGQVSTLSKLAIVRFINRLFWLSFGFWMSGAIGMVVGMASALVIYSLIIIYVQKRLGLFDVSELLKNTWRIIVSALIMYLILKLSINMIDFQQVLSPVLELGILILIGILTYCLAIVILWLFFGKNTGPEKIILNFFNSKKL